MNVYIYILYDERGVCYLVSRKNKTHKPTMLKGSIETVLIFFIRKKSIFNVTQIYSLCGVGPIRRHLERPEFEIYLEKQAENCGISFSA